MKKATLILIFVLVCLAIILADNKLHRKLSLIATTDPPSALMLKNMKEQIECAKKAGFIIEEPTLRVMKPPYAKNLYHGLAYMDLNLILLVNFASYETLAHELGHIVDAQSGRKGPQFDAIRKLPVQAFADAIKDIILSKCRSY